MVQFYTLHLEALPRGCHLITSQVENALKELPDNGLLHLFIQHTSAGLTINENYDPDVRVDLNEVMNRLIRENEPYYTHVMEGSDDMPAHVKSSLMGVSLTIPVINGKLALGTWQGIYLCEFRNQGGSRKLLLSFVS
jgi:secondary thiamine-phosphate synthase enzyme